MLNPLKWTIPTLYHIPHQHQSSPADKTVFFQAVKNVAFSYSQKKKNKKPKKQKTNPIKLTAKNPKLRISEEE